MPFHETDGATLNYELWPVDGATEWVTLLNGHTRSLDDFRPMAGALNRRGLSVLSLDNRGSGKTETFRKFSLADLAKDVRALWKTEKIRASHVVGFSFGGAVSMVLAAEQPPELRRLVLVSTRATWDITLPDVSSPHFAEEVAKYFSKDFYEAQKRFITHFGAEVQKRAQDPDRKQGITWQREAVEGMDLRQRLAKITAPTLILHGNEDRIVPFDSAETLRQHIKGAALIPFPGIGHLPLVQCPARLYEEVATFLTTVPAP